ncbi:unnamed protein product [Phytophthora fragariaefolia]|uniref:Unnamed protein product n=1 Tax=Phytophthora fragariaefolia TaxID=1490495 RepID=A0A9W6X8N0_9STRA|nr:unnamed protein product [Phytophthora fragariaefolia]
MLPAPRRQPAMPKKVTTQAPQDITLLPKIIPSCPSEATLEKLISPPPRNQVPSRHPSAPTHDQAAYQLFIPKDCFGTHMTRMSIQVTNPKVVYRCASRETPDTLMTRGNWKFSRVASSQLPRAQSRGISNGGLD